MSYEWRGYYYLHTTGAVIKKDVFVVESDPGGAAAYFDSPFCVKWWKVEDVRDRVAFYQECKALGEKQGTGAKTSRALYKILKGAGTVNKQFRPSGTGLKYHLVEEEKHE
jgi:hypothetical protein